MEYLSIEYRIVISVLSHDLLNHTMQPYDLQIDTTSSESKFLSNSERRNSLISDARPSILFHLATTNFLPNYRIEFNQNTVFYFDAKYRLTKKHAVASIRNEVAYFESLDN